MAFEIVCPAICTMRASSAKRSCSGFSYCLLCRNSHNVHSAYAVGQRIAPLLLHDDSFHNPACPFPPAALSGGFAAFFGTMGMLRLPAPRPASLRFLRSAVPPYTRLFISPHLLRMLRTCGPDSSGLLPLVVLDHFLWWKLQVLPGFR